MVDPVTSLHAARYAEGVWKNGSPIINTVTNEPTRFMFNEYPDIPGGYHEVELTNPDRRGTASFGPFYDVAPGDRICFDMAFVFARDTTQDNIQNTRVLQQKVIALKEWYEQQGLGCDVFAPVGAPDVQRPMNDLSLFPDPAADETILRRGNADDPASVMITAMTGSTIKRLAWPAGTHQLVLRVDDLSPGVYLLSVVSAGQLRTKRLVVAR